MTQISDKDRMNINTEVLSDLVALFDEKVNNIKRLLSELNNEMKKIDGTTSIWNGKVQEVVYKDYLTISNSFPNIEEQLENYKSFLDKTVVNYETEENTINRGLDESNGNLDVE